MQTGPPNPTAWWTTDHHLQADLMYWRSEVGLRGVLWALLRVWWHGGAVLPPYPPPREEASR